MKHADGHIWLKRFADRLDQLILVGLFVWLCFRFLPNGFPPKNIYTTLLLVSEGVVVLFVLFRRNTEKISTSLRDWFIALAGTMAVLLVIPSSEPLFPKLGAIFIFTGFLIHTGAKLSLRRSFGIVPADRGIKTDGLYRFVRHPMYFGYFISHIGFLLASPSLWNFAIYALAWTLFVARIRLEEQILSENSEYQAYKRLVPYRLVPRIY